MEKRALNSPVYTIKTLFNFQSNFIYKEWFTISKWIWRNHLVKLRSMYLLAINVFRPYIMAWCNAVQAAELNCGLREECVIAPSYLTFYRSAPFLCEIRFIKFSPVLYRSLPLTIIVPCYDLSTNYECAGHE